MSIETMKDIGRRFGAMLSWNIAVVCLMVTSCVAIMAQCTYMTSDVSSENGEFLEREIRLNDKLIHEITD